MANNSVQALVSQLVEGDGELITIQLNREEVQAIKDAAYKPWQRSSARVLEMLSDKVDAALSCDHCGKTDDECECKSAIDLCTGPDGRKSKGREVTGLSFS